ncbi:AI-2E family transporter [Altericroceibacterium xinjiangense]|uniref:AI-2E family transporter n=1 Tax=Altericroceibacterium xinjiangense TaxID=762261 RepID=UPI000F7EFED8|nr:AI-2E family transporter [Altericroceibacterium xinjiangense]
MSLEPTRAPNEAQSIALTARKTAVVLLLVGLALLTYALADVLVLIFGAILVAVILRAIGDPISHYTRLPHKVSVLIAVLLIALFIAAASWLVGSRINAQFSDMWQALPQGWDQIQQRLSGSWLGNQVASSLQEARPDVRDIAARLGVIVASIGGVLTDLLLVLFAGLYLALAPGLFREGLAKLFPKRREDEVKSALDNSGRALRKWLLAQLISMTIVGTLTGLGLWLAGVPYPIALGLVSAVMEFIPIVGPFLAAVPGILLALLDSTGTALWAAGVYLAVQQLESDVITPYVINEAVSIPPALTLMGVLILGALFGVMGVILAAPMLVVAIVLTSQLYVRDSLHHDVRIPGAGKDEDD